MLNDDDNGDLRVVKRRKGCKNAVGRTGRHLRRAGLSADVDAVIFKRARRRPVFRHLGHPLHDGFIGQFRHLDPSGDHRLRSRQHRGIVVGADVFQEMRLVARAAVGERGDVVGHLQRRKQVRGLADGRGQGVAVDPRRTFEAFFGLRRGDIAPRLPAELHAGVFAEAERPRVGRQVFDAELPTHVEEKDVAGIAERLDDGFVAVRQPRGAVQPAGGLIVRIVTVDARIGDDRFRRDDAELEPGHRGHHLKNRARRVDAAQRAVEHRLHLVRIELIEQLVEACDIKRRVRGAGQNVARGDVDDDGGAALDILRLFRILYPLGDHLFNLLGERPFDRALQANVDRQHDVAPRLRRLFLNDLDDSAVAVEAQLFIPVDAAQIGFKRLLRAVSADAVAELIALLRKRRILRVRDRADVAEQMGRILRRIFAPVRRRGPHAWKFLRPLADARYQLNGHVL